MFDLCAERALDGEERFVGRDGHRYAEIWMCEVSFSGNTEGTRAEDGG